MGNFNNAVLYCGLDINVITRARSVLISSIHCDHDLFRVGGILHVESTVAGGGPGLGTTTSTESVGRGSINRSKFHGFS